MFSLVERCRALNDLNDGYVGGGDMSNAIDWHAERGGESEATQWWARVGSCTERFE